MAPYLTLMREEAPQREHSLREVFNGLRWIVRSGVPWRMIPNDLPPWYTVYQQTQRWIAAGVFEAIVHDLRAVLRPAKGRKEQPSAAFRQPHAAIYAGKRRTGRVRWGEAQKGQQNPYCSGYLGTSVGLVGHLGQRTGPRPGGRTGPPGAGGERAVGASGICRSGLHRRGTGAGRSATGHPVAGGQAAGSQERLCPAAPPLGRRTLFWLGSSFPPPGVRL